MLPDEDERRGDITAYLLYTYVRIIRIMCTQWRNYSGRDWGDTSVGLFSFSLSLSLILWSAESTGKEKKKSYFMRIATAEQRKY